MERRRATSSLSVEGVTDIGLKGLVAASTLALGSLTTRRASARGRGSNEKARRDGRALGVDLWPKSLERFQATDGDADTFKQAVLSVDSRRDGVDS